MSIAIVAPARAEVGDLLVITGSGFTHSGNVKLVYASEESNGGLEVTAVIAADSSGNFSTSGVVDVKPDAEGHVNVTVTDVTATTVTSARVKVERAA